MRVRLSVQTAVFCLAFACQAHAEKRVVMTTYYPSPTGHYNKLFAQNIGIGSQSPQSNLDVVGDALIKGKATAWEFKSIGKPSLVTIILSDQSGAQRQCPAGYALTGQWFTSSGTAQFQTKDYSGNTVPDGAWALMGLCSTI